jgi:hypothetical protein
MRESMSLGKEKDRRSFLQDDPHFGHKETGKYLDSKM